MELALANNATRWGALKPRSGYENVSRHAVAFAFSQKATRRPAIAGPKPSFRGFAKAKSPEPRTDAMVARSVRYPSAIDEAHRFWIPD
jgi:hypothetical protein